jgi:hypothetical protein
MSVIPLCNCTNWCGQLTITDPSMISYDSNCEFVNLTNNGDYVVFNANLEPNTKYVISFCTETISGKKLRIHIVSNNADISTPYQFKQGMNDQTLAFTSGSSSIHHITFTVIDLISGSIKLHNIRFDKIISLINGDSLIDVLGPNTTRIQKHLSDLVVGLDQVYHPMLDTYSLLHLIEPYRDMNGTSSLQEHPMKPLNKTFFSSAGPITFELPGPIRYVIVVENNSPILVDGLPHNVHCSESWSAVTS